MWEKRNLKFNQKGSLTCTSTPSSWVVELGLEQAVRSQGICFETRGETELSGVISLKDRVTYELIVTIIFLNCVSHVS